MNKLKLAKELGVHHSTMYDWLAGKHSPKGAYRRLLEVQKPELLVLIDKAYKENHAEVLDRNNS